MHEFDMERYKLKDIVDDNYDDRHVNTVDFTLHLGSDVALDKRVERSPDDYRPVYAYYYTEDEEGNETLYARRSFHFELGANGLMVERCEHLSYMKINDLWGPEFLIRKKTYDHTNVDEFTEALGEQIYLRQDIANHIKSMLSGVIQALNPTFNIEQIIAATQPFFTEYSQERTNFIEIGSHAYRDAIAAIDLAQRPEYAYLGVPIAEGVTLQDYIVSMT